MKWKERKGQKMRGGGRLKGKQRIRRGEKEKRLSSIRDNVRINQKRIEGLKKFRDNKK